MALGFIYKPQALCLNCFLGNPFYLRIILKNKRIKKAAQRAAFSI